MTRKADGIRRRWCKPSRPASGRALMGHKTQNHKTEVSPMTREQLNAKLDRTDISGIGVECIAANGSTVYYFYEDFDGPARPTASAAAGASPAARHPGGRSWAARPKTKTREEMLCTIR